MTCYEFTLLRQSRFSESDAVLDDLASGAEAGRSGFPGPVEVLRLRAVSKMRRGEDAEAEDLLLHAQHLCQTADASSRHKLDVLITYAALKYFKSDLKSCEEVCKEAVRIVEDGQFDSRVVGPAVTLLNDVLLDQCKDEAALALRRNYGEIFDNEE